MELVPTNFRLARSSEILFLGQLKESTLGTLFSAGVLQQSNGCTEKGLLDPCNNTFMIVSPSLNPDV